jgi:hypothetical protein
VDYYGTLTMGKELAMVENNDRGRVDRLVYVPPPPPGGALLLGLRNGDTDNFAAVELLPFGVIQYAVEKHSPSRLGA